tara:strand:+ start:476 stop:901 length:426 start_codon:yes stop_codon:yes gene_type:complete
MDGGAKRKRKTTKKAIKGRKILSLTNKKIYYLDKSRSMKNVRGRQMIPVVRVSAKSKKLYKTRLGKRIPATKAALKRAAAAARKIPKRKSTKRKSTKRKSTKTTTNPESKTTTLKNTRTNAKSSNQPSLFSKFVKMIQNKS